MKEVGVFGVLIAAASALLAEAQTGSGPQAGLFAYSVCREAHGRQECYVARRDCAGGWKRLATGEGPLECRKLAREECAALGRVFEAVASAGARKADVPRGASEADAPGDAGEVARAGERAGGAAKTPIGEKTAALARGCVRFAVRAPGRAYSACSGEGSRSRLAFQLFRMADEGCQHEEAGAPARASAKGSGG